jgi:hypothetical protein
MLRHYTAYNFKPVKSNYNVFGTLIQNFLGEVVFLKRLVSLNFRAFVLEFGVKYEQDNSR